MSLIVVITHEDDAHIPFVEPHLASELVVIDPYQVFNNKELSYIFNGKESVTSYKNRLIKDVKSVWYRKPILRGHAQPKIQPRYEEYSKTAITNHIRMLRSQFSDALWISDFYAINKARNKAWQMSVASKLGFSVPKTLITSDKQKAKAFLKQQKPAIIKTLATTFPVIDNKTSFFFTKYVDNVNEVDLRNLHLAPAIFQEAIDAAADIRVTVVGDDIFCSIIRNDAGDNKDSVRDWRFQHSLHGATFEAYDNDMPQQMKNLCLKIVRKMGLLYGAIDLVIDQSGQFWFLEINPNGQWAFIEEETGQPIGKALADLLETAKHPTYDVVHTLVR